MAPAYHRNEGTTPHHGVHKHCLQYDRRPNVHSGVPVGTYNLGSLSGAVSGGVVCEELRKNMIDVCCLQEVRWRGHGARMLGMKGRCNVFWSEKGVGGVAVMVKEELCEKFVEVRRVGNCVMTVVVVFEEDVLRLICGYAPQSGRSLEGKKQSFYDELKCEWNMHSAGALVICLADFNGHSRHIDGFGGVH